MNIDTTEPKAGNTGTWHTVKMTYTPVDKINYVLDRYIWRRKTKAIFVKEINDYKERVKSAHQAHIIKAISHHFAIPIKDLEAAVRDYKPMEEK